MSFFPCIIFVLFLIVCGALHASIIIILLLLLNHYTQNPHKSKSLGYCEALTTEVKSGSICKCLNIKKIKRCEQHVC